MRKKFSKKGILIRKFLDCFRIRGKDLVIEAENSFSFGGER
jgi:hypothetical protein